MTHQRRDIDDLEDNLFDRDKAEELRREREDMVAAGAERLRQEKAYDDAVKARVVGFTKETNEAAIRAEYRAHGVEPRPGPLVSLAMLRRLGWTVEDGERGARILVAPPALPPYVPRPKECT